jgi:hypothetical protein
MSYTVANPGRLIGRSYGSGHCVALVQSTEAGAGVPHTSHWRRGVKARGGNVPRGTVIATFSDAGRYENRTDGASHVAIFLGETPTGLRVVDQWVGHPAAERVIRWGQPKKSNDGDSFFVIESA